MVEDVADTLAAQGASAQRVTRWRDAGRRVRAAPWEISELRGSEGAGVIERMLRVDLDLACALQQTALLDRSAMLDRITGDPARALQHLPNLGPCLAQRVQRELGIATIYELDVALRSGRLATLAGFGPRRLENLAAAVRARFAVEHGFGSDKSPPVQVLLSIDREYRMLAVEGRLPYVSRTIKIPVMHVEREGWMLTAMFTRSPRFATDSSEVAIYCREYDCPNARAVVSTAVSGPLLGHRRVRGRSLDEHTSWPVEDAASDSAMHTADETAR